MSENPYEPPKVVENVTAAGKANWTGWVLSLGLLLLGRMAWMFAGYPGIIEPHFPGDQSPRRFATFVVIGVLLSLGGAVSIWLSRRKRFTP